jgi:hypothetical protein
MKAGIYISGLAQSFVNESVEKYCERFMNEMNYAVTGTGYEMRSERVNYTSDKYSTVAVIFEKHTQKPVYKFYEFRYNEILTEKFNGYSLLVKNMLLLLLVVQKFPKVVRRAIRHDSYTHPYQALYLFTILGLAALSMLFMLPSLLGMAMEVVAPGLLSDLAARLSETVVSLTALILLIMPTAKTVASGIAAEFVCANDYIQRGHGKQLLQGNLEQLVEYISEHEADCKIHFHAYSFGSVLALDYIFPFGNKVTANTHKYCEAIITIGAPAHLVKSYYKGYYDGRHTEAGSYMKWLNVYSVNDALATNFGKAMRGRRKSDDGEPAAATFLSAAPEDINYEVVAVEKRGLIDGLMLYGLQAHGMYWNARTEGQSCIRLIHGRMKQLNLLPEADQPHQILDGAAIANPN